MNNPFGENVFTGAVTQKKEVEEKMVKKRGKKQGREREEKMNER